MHILAQKFLEHEEHKQLFEDYQSFPTEEKKQHLQSLFNQFHFEQQLYNYLCENIPLIAENITKKRNLNKGTSSTTKNSDESL